MILRYRNVLALSILPLIFTLFMCFLSAKINFEQNDDWAFYRAAKSYSMGDFTQNPIQIFGKSAPLFYTQGFLALLFVKIFAFKDLPLLTALVSGLNTFILMAIIYKHFNRSVVESVLLTGLFIFNPIYIYSSLGFMTENYFLLFLLLSIYSYLNFSKGHSKKHFIMFNLFMILGFFVRQFSIISSGAFGVYLLKAKKYKYFSVQIFVTLVLLIFYYFYFLSNPAYTYKGVDSTRLVNGSYAVTLVFGLVVTFSAYLFPALLGLFSKDSLKNKTFLITVLVSYLLFGVLYVISNPDMLNKGEFPYIGNTVDREGFLIRDIHGTKYHFMGIFKIYLFWQWIALVCAPLLFVAIAKNFRSLYSFFGSFLGVYSLALLAVSKIFDRYLTVFLLIFLLFLLDSRILYKKWQKVFLCGYVFFIMILSYQFSWDFVLTSKYAWEKGSALTQQSLAPSNVMVSGTWNKTYSVNLSTARPLYLVSYDSPSILNKKECCQTLVETTELKFPFSMYVNPHLYFYKR
jgi:hypothetical protein